MPAKLMLGRNIRNRFDALRFNKDRINKSVIGNRDYKFTEGEIVYTKNDKSPNKLFGKKGLLHLTHWDWS